MTGKITDTVTCIIPQNEGTLLWITSLLINIIIVSFSSNLSPSSKNMYPYLVKFRLLFFDPLHHCSFRFPVTDIIIPSFIETRASKWGTTCQSIISFFCITILGHTLASEQDSLIRVETLPHSPYSPDIAPSDYEIFGLFLRYWAYGLTTHFFVSVCEYPVVSTTYCEPVRITFVTRT